MDLTRFEKFDRACAENLAGTIDEILKSDKKIRAIGFITTDDFYGFYLAWDHNKRNINKYYDWKQSLNPEFLYQPLVDIVDSTKDIDLLRASDGKWGFAEALLNVLADNIKKIPDEIFTKNKYKRKDIKFFATMGDGDYVLEMMDASVKLFND